MVYRYGIDGIGYMATGRTNNTTYIQNNFYGNSIYGANAGYGFPNYGYGNCCGGSCFGYGFKRTPPPPPPSHHPHHHCNDELPTIAKVSLGVGISSSVIGMLTKLISNDKA